MRVTTLEQLVKAGALKDKRVFIRSDLNAPRDENGNITNEARLVASVPAIRMARDAGARVMVVSHLGRPKEGEKTPADSLEKIAQRMAELLGSPVRLIDNWVDGGFEVAPGEVVMLENCRCNVGEKKCTEELSKKYGALCDVFVNDAFGTAHRAQASTYGVAQYADVVCAGPLMAAEIEALTKAVEEAKHPLVAIVGGSKVSTKLTILNNLAQKVDQLIVGGGIANTFLMAAGYKVGKSLAEADLLDECKKILKTLEEKGATLPLPTDVVVAKEFSETAEHRTCRIEDVHALFRFFPVALCQALGDNLLPFLQEFLRVLEVIVLSVKVGPFLPYRAVWLHLKGVVRLVDLCGLAQEQDICLLLFDALPITV